MTFTDITDGQETWQHADFMSAIICRLELRTSRAVLEATIEPSEEHRFQQTNAEETPAVHGYRHPSRTGLLTDAGHRAPTERHQARGDLADLLLDARDRLEEVG